MSVQQQERTMRTVLEGIKRRDDETLLRFVYRKYQALKVNRLSGLDDDDFDAWVDAADKKEEAIARFQAEDLGDIDAKLAVLTDRIRLFMEANKAGAFDPLLAMSAREDLRRLIEQNAETPHAGSRKVAGNTCDNKEDKAATKQKHESQPPWPTCDRSNGRCQLYSEIAGLEPLLMMAENGVQVLFQLLDNPSPTINRKAVDFVADQLQEALSQIKDHWRAMQQEAAGVDPTDALEGVS